MTTLDFIPPILIKIVQRLNRRLYNLPYHPFNHIPSDIKPQYFLDIGANVGDVTLKALKSYPKCKAICFEPVQQTFNILKQNLMGLEDRVLLYNKGLSITEEDLDIHITSFHGANSILPQSKLHKLATGVNEVRKEKIHLLKLDDISKEFPTKNIDIMKIDVEGFELNVLRGGFNFIKENVDIIMIEVAPYRIDDLASNYINDIFEFMKQAGFTLISVYDLAPMKYHRNLKLGQMDCVFRNNKNLG